MNHTGKYFMRDKVLFEVSKINTIDPLSYWAKSVDSFQESEGSPELYQKEMLLFSVDIDTLYTLFTKEDYPEYFL